MKVCSNLVMFRTPLNLNCWQFLPPDPCCRRFNTGLVPSYFLHHWLLNCTLVTKVWPLTFYCQKGVAILACMKPCLPFLLRSVVIISIQKVQLGSLRDPDDFPRVGIPELVQAQYMQAPCITKVRVNTQYIYNYVHLDFDLKTVGKEEKYMSAAISRDKVNRWYMHWM